MHGVCFSSMLFAIGGGGGGGVNQSPSFTASSDANQVTPNTIDVRAAMAKRVRFLSHIIWGLQRSLIFSCDQINNCSGGIAIVGGGGGGGGIRAAGQWSGSPSIYFGAGFGFNVSSSDYVPPPGSGSPGLKFGQVANVCRQKCLTELHSATDDFYSCFCPCQKQGFAALGQVWAKHIQCTR